MEWQALAAQLFPLGHTISEDGNMLAGEGRARGTTVSVLGTTGHTPVGVEMALTQARAILQIVRDHPGRAILLLVDTQGQRLRHRDEMLGINSYMAHLGKCVDLARRSGHKIIGLVYDQALSGGFATSGMMADACYALPGATIRVMGMAAMARITRVPEERLAELARDNPVFAPGPENYRVMGGLDAIWDGDLAASLERALALPHGGGDERSALGLARGGRKAAQPVIDAIMRAGAGDTALAAAKGTVGRAAPPYVLGTLPPTAGFSRAPRP